MNPRTPRQDSGLAARVPSHRLRIRRWLMFGDSGWTQASILRYQTSHLRRRLFDPRETPGDSLVRESPSATLGSQPQTSRFSRSSQSWSPYQEIMIAPLSFRSTAASGTVFVRARARARTNTDIRSLDQTVSRASLVRELSLSGQLSSSLLAPSLLTRSSLAQLSRDVRHPYGVTDISLGWARSSLHRNSDNLIRLSEHWTGREAPSSSTARAVPHCTILNPKSSILILNPKS